MRRISPMDHQRIIEYNLRDNGHAVTIFLDTQTERVMFARNMIAEAIAGLDRKAVIWELGCSVGDISGAFAEDHEVHAIDVVPYAVELAQQRYPAMDVRVAKAEDIDPQPCDVLVLCEFLEHIVDPLGLIDAWAPYAKNIVIGHPLVGDGFDPEVGHLWAYEDDDFVNWFKRGNYEIVDQRRFDMGYWMAIGWGRHVETGSAATPDASTESAIQPIQEG